VLRFTIGEFKLKVNVVDEIMSSGKSHWMMSQMKKWKQEDKYDQFVYLSPLLSEVGGELVDGKYSAGRIQLALPEMNFTYPIPLKGSKSNHIRSLLHQGRNISATHNLFLGLDRKVIDTLGQYRNVLVIDECLDAYRVFDGITTKSLHSFICDRTFLVDPITNKMTYNHNEHPLPDRWEFLSLAELCDTGCVFYVNGDAVIWEFPYEVLSAFDEVWVLTYLFEGSFMSAWCKINGVEVVKQKPLLNRSTAEVKQYIRECIDVVETRSMMKIENYSYSQSWWQDDAVEEVVDKVRKCLESCIKSAKAKANDILIACPKLNWEHPIQKSESKREVKKRPLVKGQGFSKATWLYSDAKATNDYADKSCLIYLLGKNPNSFIYNFCSSKDVQLSRDLFALASFLQWVFRGSVRKKEKMHLIVPCKRMRDLYKLWLDTEDDVLKEILGGK
jgi:hypothetical protein